MSYSMRGSSVWSPQRWTFSSGSHTLNLQAGDVFGFRFGGSNFDSDARLIGTFTVIPQVVDSDGDGVPDGQDSFPNDPSEWADSAPRQALAEPTSP